MFSEAAKDILSLHREDLNHVINLKINTLSSFKSLYNLFEKELITLKDYINKNLANEFIMRSKSSVEILILFVKKLNEFL